MARHNFDGKIEGLGIDALTIVSRETISLDSESTLLRKGNAQGKASIKQLSEAVAALVPEQPRKPYRERYGRGWVQGSVRYVFSSNVSGAGNVTMSVSRAKMSVTGKLSEIALDNAITSLADDDKKLTRIDFYVDLRLGKPDANLAQKIEGKLPPKIKKKATFIQSWKGQTLYIGSRRSSLMLRLYDKSADYNEEIGSIWRFEVEAKGVRAARIGDGIAAHAGSVKSYALDSVDKTCNHFNVAFPHYSESDISEILMTKVNVITEEERHYWLFKVAVPAVKKALEGRGGVAQETFDLLGLDRFVDKK